MLTYPRDPAGIHVADALDIATVPDMRPSETERPPAQEMGYGPDSTEQARSPPARLRSKIETLIQARDSLHRAPEPPGSRGGSVRFIGWVSWGPSRSLCAGGV